MDFASKLNIAAWSGDSCRLRARPAARVRLATSLATRRTGDRAIAASPKAATQLAAPGPVVTSATPSLPVLRANPSALYTAVCSCRTLMMVGRLADGSALQNAKLCTPGNPNTIEVPARITAVRNESATLSIGPTWSTT